MRTPLPNRPARGIGTLIGNGWLREAPRNVWPRAWDARGRSMLRKCMFMPVPDVVRNMPLAPSSPRPPQHAQPAAPRYEAARAPQPQGHVHAHAHAHAKRRERDRSGPRSATRAWYEDPVALGTLLILCPPIGLAALWSSGFYSRDARWALTVMTALMICVAAAITVTALALR